MTGDVGVAVVPGLLCFFFFFFSHRFTPHPSPDLLCITSRLITGLCLTLGCSSWQTLVRDWKMQAWTIKCISLSFSLE